MVAAIDSTSNQQAQDFHPVYFDLPSVLLLQQYF
jgi:hypothetical protein